MAEMKNVPAIRFKGFSDEWKEQAFSLLVTRVSLISEKSELPRVEYEDIISGIGELNKNIYQKENLKAGIEFDNGDILFGKLRPYLKNWLLPNFKGIAIGDFWVLRAKETDSKFIYTLIQTSAYEKVANQSSGTKMPRSDWSLVSKTEFTVPLEIVEQGKVGSYFQHLDKLISLHQTKVNKLTNLKKAMLEKMFPKQGADVPEIRFKGFEGAWQKRPLLDNLERVIDFRGRTPKKLGMDWSESGYLALSALNVKNGFIDKNIDAHYGNQELYDKWMHGCELHKHQVLMTTEAPMGNVAQIPDNDRYILSQRTIAFVVVHERITEDFLAVSLSTDLNFRKLTQLSSGGTAKGVSQKSLSSMDIFVPKKTDEQTKIGSYFKKLDKLLRLHQIELEKLNNLKKACLEKMFV